MNKKIFNDKVDDIINKLEDNTKLKFIKIKEIFLKYYDFDRLDNINIFSNIRNNGILMNVKLYYIANIMIILYH